MALIGLIYLFPPKKKPTSDFWDCEPIWEKRLQACGHQADCSIQRICSEALPWSQGKAFLRRVVWLSQLWPCTCNGKNICHFPTEIVLTLTKGGSCISWGTISVGVGRRGCHQVWEKTNWCHRPTEIWTRNHQGWSCRCCWKVCFQFLFNALIGFAFLW